MKWHEIPRKLATFAKNITFVTQFLAEPGGEQIWWADNPGAEPMSHVENPCEQIWWAGKPGVKPLGQVENPCTWGRAGGFEPGGETLGQEVILELEGEPVSM